MIECIAPVFFLETARPDARLRSLDRVCAKLSRENLRKPGISHSDTSYARANPGTSVPTQDTPAPSHDTTAPDTL
eukprot:COSAG06_NODE_455_length_15521_cov_8.312022_19_plen_75_part_00